MRADRSHWQYRDGRSAGRLIPSDQPLRLNRDNTREARRGLVMREKVNNFTQQCVERWHRTRQPNAAQVVPKGLRVHLAGTASNIVGHPVSLRGRRHLSVTQTVSIEKWRDYLCGPLVMGPFQFPPNAGGPDRESGVRHDATSHRHSWVTLTRLFQASNESFKVAEGVLHFLHGL